MWSAGANRVPCACITFYARAGVIECRREELGAMVRAIYRTQMWVHAATPASMVSAGFFDPGTPFEQAVDNSLAGAAVAANPVPLADRR